MESSIRKEGYQVPQVELCTLDNMDLVKQSAAELFNGKKVVVFSLIGAYNRVCGEQHLADILSSYQDFIDLGIDSVYCILVNDCWVLNEWSNYNNVYSSGVKMISDANTYFTRSMGYLVNMSNFGYGDRSWRYSMVVENGIIQKIFSEEGMCNNPETDVYDITQPKNILDYLKN